MENRKNIKYTTRSIWYECESNTGIVLKCCASIFWDLFEKLTNEMNLLHRFSSALLPDEVFSMSVVFHFSHLTSLLSENR